MLLYKAVNKKTRRSIFPYAKYSLRYKKNTIVRAVPNTVGIMCFENFKDVEHFVHIQGPPKFKNQELLIIEVEAISGFTKGEFIQDLIDPDLRGLLGAGIDDLLDLFYSDDIRRKEVEPIKGTVFCKEVFILN